MNSSNSYKGKIVITYNVTIADDDYSSNSYKGKIVIWLGAFRKEGYTLVAIPIKERL